MEMGRRMKEEQPRKSVKQIQPMLTPSDSSVTDMPTTPKSFSGRGCSKVGEAVGGTAALICCFPFAVVNLVVLAVYKVPSGLLKRAWNKKKKMQRRRLLAKKNKNSDLVEKKNGVGPWPDGIGLMMSSDEEDENCSELSENEKLEDEMLGQFYRGFWRSPSQKGD